MSGFRKYDHVVLKNDYKGYARGQLGIYVKSVIDSGHHVPLVILVNDRFKEYLSNNGYDSFDEYLDYQLKNNVFKDEYITNPFDTLTPYFDGIVSLDSIDEQIDKINKDIDTLEEKKSILIDLKKTNSPHVVKKLKNPKVSLMKPIPSPSAGRMYE